MDLNISPPSSSPNLISSLSIIPAELFCDQNILDIILNDNNLWSLLDEKRQNELLDKHLPQVLDKQDKTETVKLLFDRKLSKFEEEPLETIFAKLKIAKASPEMYKMLEDVSKLKRHAFFMDEQERQCKLLAEVLNHRKAFFQLAINSSPNGIEKPHIFDKKNPFINEISRNMTGRRKAIQRLFKVRERYRTELESLFPAEEASLSDDEENFKLDLRSLNPFWLSYYFNSKSIKSKSDQSALHDEYINLLRKHRRKRKMINMDSSTDSVIDISNITLKDVIARVANDSDDESTKNFVTSGKNISLGENNFFSASHEDGSKLFSSSNFTLTCPQKKKSRFTAAKITPPPPPTTQPTILPYLHQPSTSSSSTNYPSLIHSSPLPNNSSLFAMKENDSNSYFGTNNFNCPSSIKSEPMDIFEFRSESPPHSLPLPSLSRSLTSSSSQPPITSFTSLLTQPSQPSLICDQYQTSMPLTNPTTPSISVASTIFTTVVSSTVSSLSSAKTCTPLPQSEQEIYKPAPTSFFAFLRDIFYVYSPNDYRMTLHKVEEIAKEQLREFDPNLGWTSDMVQSAMNYLSGVLPPPDMIPLVDYKEKNQQWQWIGVNRDNDEVLLSLYQDWIKELGKNRTMNTLDPLQLVPAAICPTSWTVRPTSEDEKKTYRDQEALRYQNPHKAFTFRVHGYTSVVGPVKGCGIGSHSSHATSPNKAREHAFLVSDRPPFVTLLSLVRDAAARLPNGEGTRADICELLRDSQYILPNISDQHVNGIVSGALDRLHYEKDPCVKYDVNRKVWIYLHRNRSEEEFERLHEVQIAAAKAKRGLSKTQRKIQNNNVNKHPTLAQAATSFSSFNSLQNTSNSTGGQPSIDKLNQTQINSTLVNSTLPIESNNVVSDLTTANPAPTTLPPIASVMPSPLPPVTIALQKNPSILPTTSIRNSDPTATVTLGPIPSIGLQPELLQPNQLQIPTTTVQPMKDIDLNNSRKKGPRIRNVKKQPDQDSSNTNVSSSSSITLPNIIQTSLPSAVSLSNLVGSSTATITNAPNTIENVTALLTGGKQITVGKNDKFGNLIKSQSNAMKVMPIFSTLQTIPASTEAASVVADGPFKSNLTSTVAAISSSSTPLIVASTSQLVSTLSNNDRTYMASSNKPFQIYSNIQPQPKQQTQPNTLIITSEKEVTSSTNQPTLSLSSNLATSQLSLRLQSAISTSSTPQIITPTLSPIVTTAIQGTVKVKKEEITRKVSTIMPTRPVDQRHSGKIELTMRTPSSHPSLSITRMQSPSSSATPTQITIPTSVLFGTRPGSVVLATPTGKSYMMATSGGSIVLQPQVAVANSQTNPASTTISSSGTTPSTSLAVRTYPIRVIPVTAQRAVAVSASTATSAGSHQLVARIITTNQPTRGVSPQTQIVVPPTSLQPILLASQQLPNQNE